MLASKEKLLEVISFQTDLAKMGLDLSATMELVVERTLSLVEADGAAVEMAEGDVMVYRAVAGIASQDLGLRIKASSSISGLCVSELKTLICEDSEQDPRVDLSACRRVGLRSMVVVPLNFKGHVVGVLKAMSVRPKAFSTAYVELLNHLSEVLAASMYFATRYNSDELFYRATHDGMTGLANRALFTDRLRIVVERHARSQQPVGVLMADIDGLKGVNDSLGHRAGDAMIIEFSTRLKNCARLTDAVARLGGDEFGVILSPMESSIGFNQIIDRFNEEVSRPMNFEGRTFPLVGSFGLACCPLDGSDIKTLIDVADKRMYLVKREHQRQQAAKSESGNPA